MEHEFEKENLENEKNKEEIEKQSFEEKEEENESKEIKTSDIFKDEEKKEHHDANYNVSNDIIKVILLIISGFALVLSIWIMLRSFSPAQEHSVAVLSYNVQNGVKYKVYLKQNDFYENKYLGMNELIPTPFIDYVEIDFSSVINSQKRLNYNYSYKITGNLSAYYTGGEDEKKGTIWSKQYSFVEPTTDTASNTSNVNLAQTVKVKYDTYNNYVNRYKLKASVPMDAFLTVTFNATVNADVSESNKKVSENITTSVKIPLSVSTVQITKEDKTSGQKILSNTEKTEATRNYVLLGFSIVLFIGSLAATIKLLIALKKMTENHSVLFKLNKILKDHAQVVVEIDTIPRVRHATIIEVKQFKDMIDIQQELHLPILYYKSEIVTENTFFIIHEKQIYKYVINAESEQL